MGAGRQSKCLSWTAFDPEPECGKVSCVVFALDHP